MSRECVVHDLQLRDAAGLLLRDFYLKSMYPAYVNHLKLVKGVTHPSIKYI